MLLEHLVAFGRANGRTRLTSWTTSQVPAGSAFAEAHGARAVSLGRVNHLAVADVDRAELERWVREGPARAPGYELIGWDGPTPDEHLAAFADLYHVMNDAPLDDLETNDSIFTPALIRDWEQGVAALGGEVWTLVARAPDGGLAGMHSIRIMHDWPEVTDIRTGNADSNAAMMGINTAMGYVPLMATTTFELVVKPGV